MKVEVLRAVQTSRNAFCLEDHCDCEGFKQAPDKPTVKVARIGDALNETRGKLTLLRGGR